MFHCGSLGAGENLDGLNRLKPRLRHRQLYRLEFRQGLRQGLDIGVERFVPPREQVDRFDSNSSVAIKLCFVQPSRPIEQLGDRVAFHRLDELGFSWQSR